MPKPRVYQKLLTFAGEKLKSLCVDFPDPVRHIVVIDNKFNLTDESKGIFTNLCYHTCRLERTNYKFTYVSVFGLDQFGIVKLLRSLQADAVVFADDGPARRFDERVVQHFGLLQRLRKLDAVLTVPFRLWGHSPGFSKGEASKNLLGFNLKHLLAAARGRNPFRPVEPEELVFPMQIIRTREQFDVFYAQLIKQRIVCFDTEGRSLARQTNDQYTVQFAWEIERDRYTSYVLPWKHKDHTWSEANLRYFARKLVHYFQTTKNLTVYHAAKFDITQFMCQFGMDIYLAKVWDTADSQFALDENWKFIQKFYGITRPYRLEFLEACYGIVRPKGLLAKEDRSNMSRFSLQETSEYGVYDVVTPLIIRKRQREQATEALVGYKSVSDYDKLVKYQLGVMNKTYAILEFNGVHIDLEEAKKLQRKDSVFVTEKQRITRELLDTKPGRRVNSLLKADAGIQGEGLFSTQEAVVFDIGKPAHLRRLFFDVCGLTSVAEGKSGEPSIGKKFKKTYTDEVPVVKLFDHSSKVAKLKQAFVDGIVKRSIEDPDFKLTGRLRAFYAHLGVLTGRLSCIKPNFQQIPSRSDATFALSKALVKAVKGMFTVARGRLMIASDFSAHEVRISGVLSGDEQVKKLFLLANKAIIQYRLAANDNLERAKGYLKRYGDIHITNIRNLFNLDVDKSHPLRYAVKTIIFSVVYQASIPNIAGQIADNAQTTAKIDNQNISKAIEAIDARLEELEQKRAA